MLAANPSHASLGSGITNVLHWMHAMGHGCLWKVLLANGVLLGANCTFPGHIHTSSCLIGTQLNSSSIYPYVHAAGLPERNHLHINAFASSLCGHFF